jgi:hypothetical protein
LGLEKGLGPIFKRLLGLLARSLEIEMPGFLEAQREPAGEFCFAFGNRYSP